MKIWVVLFISVILSAVHLSESHHSVATGGLVEDDESTTNGSQKIIPSIVNKLKLPNTKINMKNRLRMPDSSIMRYSTGDIKKSLNRQLGYVKTDDGNESTNSGSPSNTYTDTQKSSNDQSTDLQSDHDRNSSEKNSGAMSRRKKFEAWYSKKKNSIKKVFKKVNKKSNMLKNYNERNSTNGQMSRRKKLGEWYSSKKNSFAKLYKRYGGESDNSKKHKGNKSGKSDSSSNNYTYNDNEENSSNDGSSMSKNDNDRDSPDENSKNMSRHKKFHAWFSKKKHSFKKYLKKLGKKSLNLKNYYQSISALKTFGGMGHEKLRTWYSQRKMNFKKSLIKYGPSLMKSWQSNRRKIKIIWFSLGLWYRFHKRPMMKKLNRPGMRGPDLRSMNRNIGNRGYGGIDNPRINIRSGF